MIKPEMSAIVDAPVEQVWEFMTDWSNCRSPRTEANICGPARSGYITRNEG
jgi:ligand-binding SRPBCC domain-containing protein